LVALIWVARCRVLWLVFCFHGLRLLVDAPVCDQTPRCVLVALIWVARCRVLWFVFSFLGPRLLVDSPVFDQRFARM
jgi:hypothetical protein